MRIHAEQLHRRQRLDRADGAAGRDVQGFRFAVEAHLHRDLGAAMNMQAQRLADRRLRQRTARPQRLVVVLGEKEKLALMTGAPQLGGGCQHLGCARVHREDHELHLGDRLALQKDLNRLHFRSPARRAGPSDFLTALRDHSPVARDC